MQPPDHPGEFRQALLDGMPAGEWMSTSMIVRVAFGLPARENYARAHAALNAMKRRGIIETSDASTALGTHGAGRVWRKKPSYDLPGALEPRAIEIWLST